MVLDTVVQLILGMKQDDGTLHVAGGAHVLIKDVTSEINVK
jgi:hypothetical protein